MPNIFISENPIVCLPMYLVSDLKLAMAIANNGCIPSLVFSNYKNNECFLEDVITIKTKYKSELIISFNEKEILQNLQFFIKIIVDYNLSIELLQIEKEITKNVLNFLKNKNIKVGIKVTYLKDNLDILKHFNFVIIKGKDGAGYIDNGNLKLIETLKTIRNEHPNLCLIASGGISSYEDYKKISPYCDLIGAGTLFAMSKESCINEDVKNSIIKNKNVTKIKGFSGFQNAIVFSEIEISDDKNNSNSLKFGIQNKGGHVFIGNGIEKINEILPVSKIVSNLIRNTNL
jgi:NAD(P)H-dependent flavin oxidoreductase YrpB (nitropropane dioxygenase family)